MTRVLERELRIPLPRTEVFAFFADAENLGRITPPELGFRILTPRPIDMHVGTLIDYRLRLYGVPVAWQTIISVWEPPARFVDEQRRGPYRRWVHTHVFEEVGTETVMRDRVSYELPLPPVGEIAAPVVRAQLRRIFDYRRRATLHWLVGQSGSISASRPRPAAR